MSQFDFEEHSHRRFNPFTGDYVQVSPHRGKRPWQGQQEKDVASPSIPYDPTCYLCPGNDRIGGEKNPSYTGPYIFENDFGAITADIPDGNLDEGEFFKAKSEKGICKVLCFSPRHDLTVPELSIDEVKAVIDS